ncbi:hypothetical protein K449DRAFT_387581 [Hypoxylon sp. EC38]|nr:hypothetical protein K449DRAFT_387581 [Hypoxylon sp. EC38]
MTNTPLHAKILSIPAAPQDASPLFGVLPAEVRTFIFSLALTDYPDPTPDNQYAAETCYTRPHYFAPRKTPGLYPRRLTLTIRHADWWYWEQDRPLRFEAQWIEGVCAVLPGSVREFYIELESLERKKDQVDSIAKQMREKWFFKRTDGVTLFPDVTGGNVEVSRWSGTSTWNGQTWTRDETAPGRIDYYVVCVPFRLQHVVERKGGAVSDEAVRAASGNVFKAHKMKLHAERGMTTTVADTIASSAVPQA